LIFDNTGNVPIQTPIWNLPGFDLSGCLLPASLTSEAAAVECIISDLWKAGQVNLLASASASFSDTPGNSASPADSDEAHYYGALPAVTIVKRTNGQDANSAPGPYILVGDAVTWTYVITNTGNVPLTGIAVTDDNGSTANTADDFAAVCGSSQLPVGEAQTCTASGLAQQAQYVNSAAISAQPKVGDLLIGQPIANSDISHYFGARVSLTLEKSTNGITSDNIVPGPFILIDDTVTWSFKVTNTGNISLTNIQVWDDLGTPTIPADDRLVCTLSSLAAGNATNPNTCKFTGKAAAGQYENTGTAKVTVLEKEYTASDQGHYYGYDETQVLELTVKINDQISGSPPSVYTLQGDAVDVQYTVYNPSADFEMTINSMTDDNGTPTDPGDDVVLCPNGHITPQSSHTCIRTLAANSGLQIHTGVVVVTVQSAQMTDSTSGSYFGVTSGIALDVHTNTQDPGSPQDLPINVGDPVSWEYFIVNTSNIQLTEISILDNHAYNISCPSNNLAAGANMTCNANGSAQAGVFENDARVKGDWPDGLQASYAESVSYYYGVQGGITLEFLVNGLPADESPGQEFFIGDTVALTYELTNTGNYSMNNIEVSDSANNIIYCPATSLAAGASLTCTAQELLAADLQARLATVNSTVNGKALSATDPIYYTGVPRTYKVFLPVILR